VAWLVGRLRNGHLDLGRAKPVAGVTPVERVRDALDAANCRTRDGGRNWTCPSHEDSNPSLSLTEGRDGRVLLRCHAGCEFEAIVAAIGLQVADLQPADAAEWTPFGEPVATYPYVDQRGKLLFGVCRFEPKTFRQWKPDESKRGGKAWSVRGVTLVPYRLPELLAAVADGRTLHVVEGEKDVAAIVAAGGEATTFAMGAGKWRPGYAKWFEGADVVVVADDDEPGRRHAATVAKALAGVAATVAIVKAAEGKDAADHLAAGHGLDQFAPLWVEGHGEATDIIEGTAEATGVVESGASLAAIPVALEAGADLLADAERFLRRYIVFASTAQAVAATLFAAHTHAFEAAEVTPYLHVTSAERRSGKSLLLDLFELLARKPLLSANTTVAALFRSIGDPAPTILFDEVQETFARGADADQRELRAVLNAGYRLGGNVRRCVGEGAAMVPADFPVFCPKVLAGTGTLPDMLADRCIPIRLKRKARDATVQRFKRRGAGADADHLRRRLAGWAATALPTLTAARPELPEALNHRQQDIWEPLLAIADAAGGDWPKRARDAAIELHGAAVADESVGVLLLGHVRERFDTPPGDPAPGPVDRVTTEALLRALVDRDDGPWGDWWGDAVEAAKLKGPAVRLAKLLKPYEIKPKLLRFESGPERGYERAAFTEAWAIYCPEDATDVTSQVRGPIPHVTGSGPVTTPKQALTSNVTSVTSESAEPGAGELFDGAGYRDGQHWR
jgi:antitoxin (DNA-binding transcriptional repressor) of toxin-antitoxin stability system